MVTYYKLLTLSSSAFVCKNVYLSIKLTIFVSSPILSISLTAQIQKWSQNLITIYGNKTACTKETQGLWTFPNAFVKISDFKPFC